MYLIRIEVEGFRGAEHETIEPTAAVVPLPRGLKGSAVRDALEMLSAALTPSRLSSAAQRLGFAGDDPKIEGEGRDVELAGLDPAAVGAVVADGLRAVTVDAQIALDPPLFGRLREQAARDPRMVTALGKEAALRVKAGWLFSKDRRSAHPSVLMVRIGDVGFETTGKDQPAWLPELLNDLGKRFGRVPLDEGSVLAARWLDASLSPDPSVRAGLARATKALEAPPFELPGVGVVRSDPSGKGQLALSFGTELLRVRQLGRHAQDAVRLAYAAFVGRPDVLILDDPPSDAVRAWLTALPELEEAPVEQVWSP